MLKIKKQYFPHVVKDMNLLVLGDDDLSEFNSIFNQFNKKLFQEVTKYNTENLSAFILANNIKVVILNTPHASDELSDVLRQTKLVQDIMLGVCCGVDSTNINEKVINMCDMIFTRSVTDDELLSKIYNILYTQSEPKTQQSKPTSKSAYRDAFEVDVMILSEELHRLSQKIVEGDISDEVFKALHQHISKVTQIVNGYMMSSDTIKKFIQMFDKFLQTFDKNKVSIKNIEGFDYLARLVEDIAVFLNKYFVEKKFDVIYLVENSLRDSFKFMNDKFDENNDDKNIFNL